MSPGFRHLQQFSLAKCTYRFNRGQNLIIDDILFRILRESFNLRLLDLRGCSKLTSNSLKLLRSENLESLFLSRSSILRDAR